MKKILAIGLVLLATNLVKAQIKAITDKGDEVILNANGTWAYVNQPPDIIEISVNENRFSKKEDLTFLVKSNKIPFGVWINPKIWNFSKDQSDNAREFIFTKKDADLYVMLITEKIEIPVEVLIEIALKNARKVAPDAKIISQEYRFVNSSKVLKMVFTGTAQGVKFIFHGYYYSNSKGTIQLVAFTGESLIETYKNDIEDFLNGFVVLSEDE